MNQEQIAQLIAGATCINNCIPQGYQVPVLIYLASLIATGGGSASNVVFANYGGGQPNFVPISGTGVAIDTSNGTQWAYYNGAWH